MCKEGLASNNIDPVQIEFVAEWSSRGKIFHRMQFKFFTISYAFLIQKKKKK